MKYKIHIKDKGFFLSLFKKISLFAASLILTLSALLYLISGQAMLQNINMSNERLLSQISKNIEVTHNYLGLFTVSAYNSFPVIKLLNVNDLDFVEQYSLLQNVADHMHSNPYVDSVYIVNEALGNYYIVGSFSVSDRNNFYDEEILSMLKSVKPTDYLKPIPRKIPLNSINKAQMKNVYSYIIGEKSLGPKASGFALIVNMKAEWFLDNIKSDYGDNSIGSSISIIDKNGVLVATSKGSMFLENISNEPYIKNLLSTKADSGFFTGKVNGVDSLVTYVSNNTLGWYIYSTIPLSTVTAPVDKVRNTIIIICLFVFITAVILSFTLSKTIYNPLGKLFNEVRKSAAASSNGHIKEDEIKFISETIKEAFEKINSLKKSQESQLSIIKEKFIKDLLTQDAKFTADMEKKFLEYGVTVDPNKRIAVILLVIDKYAQFYRDNTPNDRALYRFAMQNIASEIFSGYSPSETVVFENQVVSIVNIDDVGENTLRNIKEIQEAVNKYFKISLTASVSSVSDKFNDLRLLYREALELSNYRINRGYQAIITPASINLSNDMSFRFPVEIVKDIVDALKLSKLEKAKEHYNSLILNITGYSYGNIRFALTHLFLSIYNELNAIKNNGAMLMDIDYNSILQRINGAETIESINDEFYSLFEAIVDRIDNSKDDKYDKIIRTSINYISLNYSDKNLSANTVAEKVMMSPVYFGMLFREATSKSISDYINEIRLVKSAELLEKTDLSILEILEKIGWENQKYFYVKFKKHFGVTPSTYRVSKLTCSS